jgi:hypothetical protein
MCSIEWTRIGALFALIALLLSAPLLGGCMARTQDPVEEPDPAESEPIVRPSDPAMALDAVLAYLREEYGRTVPAAGIAWQAQDATPGGLVGSNTTVYTSEGWTVTVLTPVVNPVDVVYQVTVDDEALGFHWAGQVDATGHVMTLKEPSSAPVSPMPLDRRSR